MAVANSASAIDGATTASEVFFDIAMFWKACMMPQTVPNRPMNGRGGGDDGQAAQAFLGLAGLARDQGVHHPVDALDQEGGLGLAHRALGLGVAPFLQGRLQHARQRMARIGAGLGRDLLQPLARADLVLESVGGAVQAEKRNSLSMITAHEPSEARISPTITALTTQSAWRNSEMKEKLWGPAAASMRGQLRWGVIGGRHRGR
jgi:hypothetical protein